MVLPCEWPQIELEVGDLGIEVESTGDGSDSLPAHGELSPLRATGAPEGFSGYANALFDGGDGDDDGDGGLRGVAETLREDTARFMRELGGAPAAVAEAWLPSDDNNPPARLGLADPEGWEQTNAFEAASPPRGARRNLQDSYDGPARSESAFSPDRVAVAPPLRTAERAAARASQEQRRSSAASTPVRAPSTLDAGAAADPPGAGRGGYSEHLAESGVPRRAGRGREPAVGRRVARPQPRELRGAVVAGELGRAPERRWRRGARRAHRQTARAARARGSAGIRRAPCGAEPPQRVGPRAPAQPARRRRGGGVRRRWRGVFRGVGRGGDGRVPRGHEPVHPRDVRGEPPEAPRLGRAAARAPAATRARRRARARAAARGRPDRRRRALPAPCGRRRGPRRALVSALGEGTPGAHAHRGRA
ncbi:unnamed protein product [Pedinophyceae sp. YPF-701]|nr:unnamed protein product [Pedinophyceae sp. YPF-701]